MQCKRFCHHCQDPFIPNRYNHHHQLYCNKVECRRISKLEKQRKWRRKKRDNPKFRAVEVKRVQEWRKKNRSRSQARDRKKSLSSHGKTSSVSDSGNPLWLRDLLHRQSIILTGIASQLLADPGANVQTFLNQCYERGRQYESAGLLSDGITPGQCRS